MHITRIILDAKKNETAGLIASPNRMHGAVEHAFKGDLRKLWRLDRYRGIPQILVVTEAEPDLAALLERYGVSAETKDYAPLLRRAADGTVWRFRLKASPTKAEKRPGNARGKVVMLRSEADMAAWLVSKGEKNGFSIMPGSLRIIEPKRLAFRKEGEGAKTVQFGEVTYDGILTVTDGQLFGKALTDGIGREKAYGMGLLTIAPVK